MPVYKILYRNLKNKAIRAMLLIVFFPIIALRLLGLLQPLEWAAYDLLFHFSTNELTDKRIVIVAWEEADLQQTQEKTLSDFKLVSLLKQITEQKPRVIGLDLYRDISYPSRLLEKSENEQAYNELQEIFRSTRNLIGIEKVREPTINPPLTLKKENRVFSSDLITDSDNIVRRSFLDPQPEIPKNHSTTYGSVPYLGVILANDYLFYEGFSTKFIDNGSFKIFKDNHQVILDNLKNFDGAYIRNNWGLDFLVNWRRAKQPFEIFSTREVLSGTTPANIFEDKIVLIGNVASSTADRHYLPIKRWNQHQPWTYGIYIPAHVASSIISATLDGRPLIKVAPWGSGYFLFLISTAFLAYTIFKYSDLLTPKLYFISALFSLVLTFILGLFSLLAFKFGFWIPIIPSILGIWLTFLTVNNHIQIKKEQENVLKLESISTYLTHKLGNSLRSIRGKTNRIKRFSIYINDYLHQEHLLAQETGIIAPDENFEETEEGQHINEILTQIEGILTQIKTIIKYKNRTVHFIEINRNKKQLLQERTNINEFIQEIINRIKREKQLKFSSSILIEEIYDPDLKSEKIDRANLEIILDNLLDNAFDAIEPNLQQINYNPEIKIQTQNISKLIKIIVQDNGIGMSRQRQSMIFKPFVSFKIDRGQGIGLSLVKNILTLEQGKIRVESKLGEGSKFIILLPKK